MKDRILLVIPQLEVGGAETQLVRLALGLDANAFEPEVAVFYPGGALEPALRQAGIRVHHIRRTTRLGHESIVDLARLLRRERHAVLHSFLRPANWRARIAARLASTPVVIASARSVETEISLPHVVLDRLLARWTDAIIVNASAIRDSLVKRERLRPDLFRVIENGLDVASFADLPNAAAARLSLGFRPDEPLVVCVGNLQPEKNHEDFLRMAALIHREDPQVSFVLVGAGDRGEDLRALSSRLGLNDALVFAGFREDVRPYLAACDVFLNTSRREGCCNAILEAMAARRPVVAYRVGGNPELVMNGETGTLVEFGDVAALATAVKRYLEEPGLRDRHGDAGYHRAERSYGTKVMARRTSELYVELLHRKRGAAQPDTAAIGT